MFFKILAATASRMFFACLAFFFFFFFFTFSVFGPYRFCYNCFFALFLSHLSALVSVIGRTLLNFCFDFKAQLTVLFLRHRVKK